MTRTSLYEIVGIFENPIFEFKKRNVVLYIAETFKEAFRAAETAGLKKVFKAVRVPFIGELESCPVIDINTRQYVN